MRWWIVGAVVAAVGTAGFAYWALRVPSGASAGPPLTPRTAASTPLTAGKVAAYQSALAGGASKTTVGASEPSREPAAGLQDYVALASRWYTVLGG